MNMQISECIKLENDQFCLYLRNDCTVQSLIHKPSGTECLMTSETTSLFSLTEERPYNNEIKLAHPNKRTTFQANRVRLEGNKLIIGFELITFEAIVEVKIAPRYMAFQLVDFVITPEDFGRLALTPPPVYEFRLLQLPVKARKNFGEWLNVTWDETVAVNVLAASPFSRIESERRKEYMIMTADVLRDVKLKNCSAALIVSSPYELLDSIETLEIDYNLPRGVASRRSKQINASTYWANNVTPKNIDEHIKYAQKAGFRMMLLYYAGICKELKGYDLCGNYDFREEYPNGVEDLKKMLQKIKNAGITPGIHFLHSHIGLKSRYLTPIADHRLNLTRYFTLAKPLGTDDTTIYVEQNPEGSVTEPRCRILKFDGELISYESYTTEYPYCFTGCKRGHNDTHITHHSQGVIGGLLDVSEFGASSAYINETTSLQDEVAEKIANIYNAGFEFVYFDGSEGTNAPFEIYIPYAQYRVYKKLINAPIYCEGAAKAHFSWHILSGGNAFDVFPAHIFKEKIAQFPAEEAGRMAKDFTRINFGWWAFYKDTQPDMFEYGTSRAAAWDCPITMMENIELFKSHPRTDDIFEVLRRWEDLRQKNLITQEMKEQLRNNAQEHILLINESQEYEMVPYDCIKNAANGNTDVSAFIFDRNCRSYVVCWHNTGSGYLSLPLSCKDVIYEAEIGGEKLAIEAGENSVTIPLTGRHYLSSSLPKEVLKEAFINAILLD